MQLSHQTSNILVLILNTLFLLFAYKKQMQAYDNEDTYQGSTYIFYKYFHETRNAITNSQVGRNQYNFQLITSFVLPVIIFIAIQNIFTQSNLRLLILNLFLNTLLLGLIIFIIIFTNNLILKNQIFPDKWLKKRVFYQVLKKEVYNDLVEQIKTSTYQEWSENDINQISKFLKQTNEQLEQDDIIQIIVLLQKHGEFSEPVSETLKYSYTLTLNDAEMLVKKWKDEWDNKSDEEKHHEFLQSKRIMNITFLIMALIFIVPNIFTLLF